MTSPQPGEMPIEAGATYVFDLGCYDYGWWAELDDAACRLVARLKFNTPMTGIEQLPVPADQANILADRISFLPERIAMSRASWPATTDRCYRAARSRGAHMTLAALL